MLRGEMSHFMTNFNSYLMFEVLEGAWLGFAESLHRVTDLDSLIQAHEAYLSRVLRHSFLEGPSSETALLQLGKLLDAMLQFRHVHDRIFDTVSAEVARLEGVLQRQRSDRVLGISSGGKGTSQDDGKEKEEKGNEKEQRKGRRTMASTLSALTEGWGTTVTESEVDKRERKRFLERLKTLTDHLETLDGGFQALLKGFFRALNAQRGKGTTGIVGISQVGGVTIGTTSSGMEVEDPEALAQARAVQSHVDFLRFRLDFNEFYIEKYKAAALGKMKADKG